MYIRKNPDSVKKQVSIALSKDELALLDIIQSSIGENSRSSTISALIGRYAENLINEVIQ